MNNQYEQRLGTDRMLPLVFRMALPSVAAQMVNLLYGIVDRIYIGHIPMIGTDALAGVGVTNSIILLISAFSQIVGGGVPLASIALGNGDHKQAEKILGNGCFLLLASTVITMLPSYLFMEPILRLTGASARTLPYAVGFLSIYLIGTPFVQITTGLNSFISSQGRPGIAMWSVLVGTVLNIGLDPFFIFALHMGVKGAALANVISQLCSAGMVLAFLCSRQASLRIRLCYAKPNRKVIGSILSLGVSPFVMASTESLIGFVLNGNLERFGDIYVSALTVMQSAMQMVSVPLNGFSQGIIPVLSYNFGHGKPKRVKEGFRIMMIVMFSVNFILNLFMIMFPCLFGRIFTSDASLLRVIARAMPIFLMGMTIFGLQRACQNTFVALGQAKVSLFIALLRKVILLVPLAFILPCFMGVMGVYSAEAIADGTAAILCTIIFSLQFPKILAACARNEDFMQL